MWIDLTDFQFSFFPVNNNCNMYYSIETLYIYFCFLWKAYRMIAKFVFRSDCEPACVHNLSLSFLPRDAMRCAVLLSYCPFVRLSVRPSDTLVDCVHMVQPTITISSPYGSSMIMFLKISRSSQNSKGVTPSEGVE